MYILGQTNQGKLEYVFNYSELENVGILYLQFHFKMA